MAASAGDRVGPYELLAPIGVGGMGEVWKAKDTRLDRQVAVKFASERFSERFEREARAVASLNHPHVCTLYDVGPDYLVMELIDGQPLTGPLPLDRVRMYAAQILSALDAAHRKGITHRDLKPANILVTRQGIKLLDFGLAKQQHEAGIEARDQEQTGSLTSEHTILGTVPYMSPEQALGKAADTRSDIFSFGLVLYEMITGTRAFGGNDPASVMAAIVEREAPSVATVTSLKIDRVLQKCLAKDPVERWQSARDLRTALEWTNETIRASPGIRLTKARIVVIAFAALATGGALGWFGALFRAPVALERSFSLELRPPAGTELDLSVQGGGSAISPDGRHVALVATADGIPKLWVRALDSVTSREFPNTEGAFLPFWSPDGRALGYFSKGYLRRVDVSGGASTALTPVSSPRGGSWSADGTIFFAEGAGPMQKISASGGSPSPLVGLGATEISHRWPRFTPDGRTLFFYVQGEQPGVYMTTLDRPDVKRQVVRATHDAAYVPGDGVPGHVLMVQGDALVAQPFDLSTARFTGPVIAIPGAGNAASNTANRSYLSVANDGTILYTAGTSRYQLTWFSPDGTVLGTVGPPDRYVGLRLSPTGTETMAFIDDETGSRDLWRLELTRNVRGRLTFDNQGNFGIWSPDAKRIVFSGLTRQTLFEKGAGETEPGRTLLRSEYGVFPIDWSLDGSHLLYTTLTPTGYDVWMLPMGAAGKSTPLLQTPATEYQGQFSPDGRWITFTSDESGREEVYVQAFPNAKTRQLVSTGGGNYPRWGKKGSELFYRSLDGRLMAAPLGFNGSSVSVGEQRMVLRLIEPPGVQLYPYDIASDGRVLAMVPAAGAASDVSLTVLVNWQAALRR